MSEASQTPSELSPDQWKLPLAALAISATASIAIYLTAGDTLDLFIAGPFVVAMLVPGFVAPIRSRVDSVFAASAILLPVLFAWLVPIFHGVISLAHWIPSAMVLASFALAAAGLTRLLGRFCHATIASTLVTLTLLAWLSWPVWLSPQLTGAAGSRAVDWLTPAHPLFAINSAVQSRLGIWSEQPVAYTLTNLGQDVQYVLPRHVNWAVLWQLFTALLIALPAPHASRMLNAASETSPRTPLPRP